jgi:hypothetical protein
VYLDLLSGIEPLRARAIVRTADAVFDSMLRAWSAGRLPIVDLYDYVSDAVALLFGQPMGAAAAGAGRAQRGAGDRDADRG